MFDVMINFITKGLNRLSNRYHRLSRRLLRAFGSLTQSYNIEITEGGKITTSLSSPVDHDPEVPTRNTALKVDNHSRQQAGYYGWLCYSTYQNHFIYLCNSYGDKSPKSIVARIFSIIWIMLGLIAMAIFTANVTSALTAASLEVKLNSLEGYKVF